MNILKQFLTMARIYRRDLGTRPRVSKKFAKLKATQKRFQIDDGVPIYLKKGLPDKMLYNATLLGLLVSTGMGLETLIDLTLKR